MEFKGYTKSTGFHATKKDLGVHYMKEAKAKALKKAEGNRMPNGEKRHNLDLNSIKGKKFGVGTFHK